MLELELELEREEFCLPFIPCAWWGSCQAILSF